ncbi:MAG: ATP-binding protein [Lachnospiraceae bacterium]|nr:ATP-binding protein [Lachnospiraceae bacterium]
MENIEFLVGAKAARLIGRENIADVDGALVELIKNAYDADATYVFVKFDMPFAEIPEKISKTDMYSILKRDDIDIVMNSYDIQKDICIRKKALTADRLAELAKVLFKYNRIIISDNGTGMDADTVRSSWMYIGTSDKETNYISARGRVKTGSKGIGRFALDKLSTKSLMYTSSSYASGLLRWEMDWDQFAEARLISEVKASLREEMQKQYADVVRVLFPEYAANISDEEWENGTTIVLSPTRDPWTRRLFDKLNTNLKSINPIGSVDQFKIFIKNNYHKEYDYESKEISIAEDDYDYRLRISYKGRDSVSIGIQRNEVDIKKDKVTFSFNDKTIEKNTSEFWGRTRFQKEGFHREQYRGEQIKDIPVSTLLPDDDIEKVMSVGPFKAELYFLRNSNRNDEPLIKYAKTKSRKSLLKSFAGIKLYRDDFKVRPYGDAGTPMYDWIGLGERAQKSPAPPGHLSGRWRAQPNQMIGWIKIGREANPRLEDMANREGIALTDIYYIFVDMIRECISRFEEDRQIFFREYARWRDEVEIESGTKIDLMLDKATSRKNQKDGDGHDHGADNDEQSSDTDDRGSFDDFTEDDYLDAVQSLSDKANKELRSKQILQIMSASGIILNTFFHEFSGINTQFHVQAAQIRSRVNYILQGKEYTGLAAYDPYVRLDALEANDRVTAAFLDVVMNGIKKDALTQRMNPIKTELAGIMDEWKVILEGKKIHVSGNIYNGEQNEEMLHIATADLYIILNNFILNSVWFIESEPNEDRQIIINCDKEADDTIISMENNGPHLDKRYWDNPDRVFELGETSKGEKGTGLGLWIVRETALRNKGEARISRYKDGFGIKIIFSTRNR